eukprot:549633_1
MMVVTETPFAPQISFLIILVLCEAALMNINIRPGIFKKILSLKLWVVDTGLFFKNLNSFTCFRYLIKKTMKEKKWIKISIQYLNKCFEMIAKDVNNADVKCMKKILEYQAYFLFRQGHYKDECETELIKLIRNVKDNQVRERLIIFLQKMFKKDKGMLTCKYDQEYEAFEDICIILKSKENRLCMKNTMMGK